MIMCSIKWDDKYFEESGLYVWIFNKGKIERTSDKFNKNALARMYYQKRISLINNNVYKADDNKSQAKNFMN